MKRPALSLIIDKLQLEGVPTLDKRALAPLIERELAGLISTLDPQAPPPRARLSAHSPTITLSPQDGAQAASRKIAAAIFQSVFVSVRGRS